MESVMGNYYDAEIVNNPDDFMAEIDNYSNPAVFFYDYDAQVGILMKIEDYEYIEGDEEEDIDPDMWFWGGGEILVVNAHGMDYKLYSEGELVDKVHSDAWSGTVFEIDDDTFYTDIDAQFIRWSN